MTGIGGVAGSMGPVGPVSEEEDELPLDLSDEGEDDEFADDLGGVGEEPAGDLGDDLGDLDLGEGGGQDALEVACPDCGSTITVRLVPEVEAEGELDMGGEPDLSPDVDLDVEGGPVEGPPEEGLPGPREYSEGVNPSVIARLLTDDPDIFTK